MYCQQKIEGPFNKCWIIASYFKLRSVDDNGDGNFIFKVLVIKWKFYKRERKDLFWFTVWWFQGMTGWTLLKPCDKAVHKSC